MKNISTSLVAIPFLVFLVIIIYFQGPNLVDRNFRFYSQSSITNTIGGKKEGGGIFRPFENELIAPGTDKDSCLSRFESSLYRRTLPRKPSPYLVSKLRAYEERHRRCGPNTEPYKRAVKKLKSGDRSVSGPDDCNYSVYLSSYGLGNRILTSTASFLYALLTDRVFLIHFGDDVPKGLFCEPVGNASWSLPNDFPLVDQFWKVGRDYPETFGNMVINKNISVHAPMTDDHKAVAPYMYVHVLHDFTSSDKLFFCDDYHNRVKNVPWLVFSANNYFVPAFFLMPSFEAELSRLFPERETVFHHLGRYLYNPSNSVWGMVKRYHQAYLAKADEIVGIQIRSFFGDGFFPHVMDQMLACVKKGNLLPEVLEDNNISSSNIHSNSSAPKRRAVLVTSLMSGYFDRLQEMYWQNPTRSGDFIGIFQPSHEERQQTEKQAHNSKAWAEMNLLSLADVLVTSGWSTFGYVAQGLGGLRPWLAPQGYDLKVPDPPCTLTETLEPCFLSGLDQYMCRGNMTDPGLLVPHVKHCEDTSVGLKVF